MHRVSHLRKRCGPAQLGRRPSDGSRVCCGRPRWKATATWPPHDLARQPLQLFLGRPGGGPASQAGNGAVGGSAAASVQAGNGCGGSGGGSRAVHLPAGSKGSLTGSVPSEVLQWRQEVDHTGFLQVRPESRTDDLQPPTAQVLSRRLQIELTPSSVMKRWPCASLACKLGGRKLSLDEAQTQPVMPGAGSDRYPTYGRMDCIGRWDGTALLDLFGVHLMLSKRTCCQVCAPGRLPLTRSRFDILVSAGAWLLFAARLWPRELPAAWVGLVGSCAAGGCCTPLYSSGG